MSVLEAQEATQIVICKAYGCSQDATARLGPYAGLCDEHQEQAAHKRSEDARVKALEAHEQRRATNGNGNGRSPAPRRAPIDGGLLSGRLKELIALARSADKQKALAERKTQEALEAKAAYDQLVDEFETALHAAFDRETA